MFSAAGKREERVAFAKDKEWWLKSGGYGPEWTSTGREAADLSTRCALSKIKLQAPDFEWVARSRF
jgi:hypothetical protein